MPRSTFLLARLVATTVLVATPWSCIASLLTRLLSNQSCFAEGRLLFCNEGQRNDSTKVIHASSFRDSETLGQTEKSHRVVVDVTIKSKELAAKFSDGSLAEYLMLLGPISRRSFDDDGHRLVEVSLPQLGLWAHWQLRERAMFNCGEGGVTWAMAVVLANYLASAPEYPRLRILELGSGTGLVSLVLSGRGHTVVATEGEQCALENLRFNVQHQRAERQIFAELLRWEVLEDRARVGRMGPFDAIVGADLISDGGHCDSLSMVFQQMLLDGAEALLVERDRAQRATACSSVLRNRGWHVERVPIPANMEHAKVDGEGDPRSLRLAGTSPLVLRITRASAFAPS